MCVCVCVCVCVRVCVVYQTMNFKRAKGLCDKLFGRSTGDLFEVEEFHKSFTDMFRQSHCEKIQKMFDARQHRKSEENYGKRTTII